VKRPFVPILFFALALGSGVGVAAGSVEAQPLSDVVLSTLGPGYAVVNDGPLTVGALTPVFPAATIIRNALTQDSVPTFQRTWQDASHADKIQILLVRFNSANSAGAFWNTLHGQLAAAHTLSTQPVPGMPGSFRTTYFAASSSQVGVGQVIVIKSGSTVATLSFFSSGSRAISLFAARNIAQVQVAAIGPVSLPVVQAHHATRSDHLWDWIGLGIAAALVVVLAAGLVVAGRNRRSGQELVTVAPVEPARPMDWAVVAGIVAASLIRRRSWPRRERDSSSGSAETLPHG
jgi:hypothetical protein